MMHLQLAALVLGAATFASSTNVPRQNAPSAVTTAPVSAAPASTPVVSGAAPTPAPASGVASASGVAPAGNTTGPNPFLTYTGPTSFSLASSNPTAMPLSSIVSGAPTQATVALNSDLVATPGATPPISGAPPLPTWVFEPGTFPALDLVPPTNSSQVEQWIAEVANSGVTIPNIAPTIPGGCATNPQAVQDTSRCWWTCGECVRPTDITTCPDKLTWGLSYDDGPSPYTPDLLNYMDANSLKSTFFIVGSRAISRPAILQAEYMGGHQLSTHTWSHPYLTTLTNEQIIAELGWTREAIRQITGVSPNTMRPPYGDIDDRVRAICQAMGMTPIIWTSTSTGQDFDTNDWHIPSGFPPQDVLASFDEILLEAVNLTTGFIVLAHDLYQQTVDLAIGYILPDALARRNPQFTLQPIITCLHKPLSDAYVETNNNQTNPLSAGSSPGTSTSSSAGSSTQSGTSTAKKSSALGFKGYDGMMWPAVITLLGMVGAVVTLL